MLSASHTITTPHITSANDNTSSSKQPAARGGDDAPAQGAEEWCRVTDELAAAKPLPLREEEVALVDRQRGRTGACVIAWDGKARIKLPLDSTPKGRTQLGGGKLEAPGVTGCYAFVVCGSDGTYHLRTVQPGTMSFISAVAATGGMGNHFLAAAAPLGAGEQRALHNGDRLLVGSPPSLEVECRVPVRAVTDELAAAKPLPLNSGGGVALVGCQRCDGACVVAWDGVTCIETSLAKWDRRRCVDEKCMRPAKSWFALHHSDDQLMLLASPRPADAAGQQLREVENSWRGRQAVGGSQSGWGRQAVGGSGGSQNGWGRVAETFMGDPRWEDYIVAVRRGGDPSLTWSQFLAAVEYGRPQQRRPHAGQAATSYPSKQDKRDK
jgi:hypothetical protein